MSNVYVEHLLTEIDGLKWDLREAQLKADELETELGKVKQELEDVQWELRKKERECD